jgi:hypothetical protein
MNQAMIERHPIAELFKESKQYIEEPGDEIWEKARCKLQMLYNLNDDLIKETVFKAMVFDCLKELYDNTDGRAYELENKNLESVLKLIKDAFEHIENLYKEK